MVRKIKPSIEILGQFDSVKEAWKRSRPHLSGDDLQLHVVNDIDLPVHGAAVYAINVNGSVAFREMCFLLRPQTGAWAISDRTKDIKRDDIEMSTEVPERFLEYSQAEVDNFIQMKEELNIPQDLCKKVLPYGRMTNFTIVCDKRTLRNVVMGLEKDFPTFYEVYGKQLKDLIPALMEVSKGGDWLLDSLLVSDKDLHALENGPIKMGRMNLIGGKIQGVLLSQFIRKIYDSVQSNILEYMKTDDIYGMNQESEFITTMYLPDSSFAKMQSTRTCAFAMFDKEDNSSWSSVLPVEYLSPKEFAEQLPCGGCASKCAFRKEQLPRLIAGNNVDYSSKGEVNPPCALQTGVAGAHMVRGLKFDSDSRIFDKWTETLIWLESEGKLPLTDDGVEYLKNVNNHGFAEAQDNSTRIQKIYKDILNTSNKNVLDSMVRNISDIDA